MSVKYRNFLQHKGLVVVVGNRANEVAGVLAKEWGLKKVGKDGVGTDTVWYDAHSGRDCELLSRIMETRGRLVIATPNPVWLGWVMRHALVVEYKVEYWEKMICEVRKGGKETTVGIPS